MKVAFPATTLEKFDSTLYELVRLTRAAAFMIFLLTLPWTNYLEAICCCLACLNCVNRLIRMPENILFDPFKKGS